jgi:hypothetical protein
MGRNESFLWPENARLAGLQQVVSFHFSLFSFFVVSELLKV